jgi:hypothetical protein
MGMITLNGRIFLCGCFGGVTMAGGRTFAIFHRPMSAWWCIPDRRTWQVLVKMIGGGVVTEIDRKDSNFTRRHPGIIGERPSLLDGCADYGKRVLQVKGELDGIC